MGRLGKATAPLKPCIPYSKFPQTATEWAEILALQKQFHSVEVHKWRQILRASVELLDEVRLWGRRALWSDPTMWQTHLGLSFFLRKMRKPFIVPSSRGCWTNRRKNWPSSQEKYPRVSDLRHGWIQPPSFHVLTLFTPRAGFVLGILLSHP